MAYKYPPRSPIADVASPPAAEHGTTSFAPEPIVTPTPFPNRATGFATKITAHTQEASILPSTADKHTADRHATHEAAWYEDVRFGSVLIGVLLLLNVALIYALPHVVPLQPAAESPPTMASAPSEIDMPTPPPSSITLYAHGDGAAPAVDAATPVAPNMPPSPSTVSPNFPPPKAPPLDSSKSMEENLNHSDGDSQ